MRSLWLSCVLLAPLLLQDSRPTGGPEVGKPAPAFRLNDHTGRIVAFGGKSDRWTVLAFYPKAATAG
jgi:hypothetical protein